MAGYMLKVKEKTKNHSELYLGYRSILRVVVTVLLSALALWLLYLLRQPIVYLILALFVAVFLSAPIGVLKRRMSENFAILTVYLGVILIPLMIALIMVPPLINGGSDIVEELPNYSNSLQKQVNENNQLKKWDDDFGLTKKAEEFASDAAGGLLSDAPGLLTSIGAGAANLVLQVFVILVFSLFMVKRGFRWIEPALKLRPSHEAERIEKTLRRMANAMSNFVVGAFVQALLAGTSAFIILLILGVPAPLALAVLVAILDLIPLVGATIAGLIVAVVTLFSGFPLTTMVWGGYMIAYQQFENYVLQPRIQARAVQLDPFVVVVAVLFGGALFGIVGALLAIPTAAALQIAVREAITWRQENRQEAELVEPEPGVI